MLKYIEVKNHLNETLRIPLSNSASTGLLIKKIDGLGPGKANVNFSDTSNPEVKLFESASMEVRNIVIEFLFLDVSMTIEEARHVCYKYFPLKKKINIGICTDEQTYYINAYVESNKPEIFEEFEGAQVSLLCETPYFESGNTYAVNLGGEHETDTINYKSEDEVGLDMTFTFDEMVNKSMTISIDGEGEMKIDPSKLPVETNTVPDVLASACCYFDEDINISGTGASSSQYGFAHTFNGEIPPVYPADRGYSNLNFKGAQYAKPVYARNYNSSGDEYILLLVGVGIEFDVNNQPIKFGVMEWTNEGWKIFTEIPDSFYNDGESGNYFLQVCNEVTGSGGFDFHMFGGGNGKKHFATKTISLDPHDPRYVEDEHEYEAIWIELDDLPCIINDRSKIIDNGSNVIFIFGGLNDNNEPEYIYHWLGCDIVDNYSYNFEDPYLRVDYGWGDRPLNEYWDMKADIENLLNNESSGSGTIYIDYIDAVKINDVNNYYPQIHDNIAMLISAHKVRGNINYCQTYILSPNFNERTASFIGSVGGNSSSTRIGFSTAIKKFDDSGSHYLTFFLYGGMLGNDNTSTTTPTSIAIVRTVSHDTSRSFFRSSACPICLIGSGRVIENPLNNKFVIVGSDRINYDSGYAGASNKQRFMSTDKLRISTKDSQKYIRLDRLVNNNYRTYNVVNTLIKNDNFKWIKVKKGNNTFRLSSDAIADIHFNTVIREIYMGV